MPFSAKATPAFSVGPVDLPKAELRDVVRRMDEGSLPGAMAVSRLRQALNEVELGMLLLSADAGQGAP
jgi:hypothetical protein